MSKARTATHCSQFAKCQVHLIIAAPFQYGIGAIFLVPCMMHMAHVQLLIASPLQDGLSTFTDEYPFQKPIVIRDIFVSVCLYAFLNFLKRL